MYVLKWIFLHVFDKIKSNVIRYSLATCSKFKYSSVYVLIHYGYQIIQVFRNAYIQD